MRLKIRGKYYNTCPHCGANLDPCERCECESEQKAYSYRLAFKKGA